MILAACAGATPARSAPAGVLTLVLPAVLDTALHHIPDFSKRGDIFRRSAVDGDEIRQQSLLHLPEARVDVQHASGDGRRALQRRFRRHAIVDHQLYLAGIVAVREDADVAAAQNRHARVERRLEAGTLPRDARGLRSSALLPSRILRRRVTGRERWTVRDVLLLHQL